MFLRTRAPESIFLCLMKILSPAPRGGPGVVWGRRRHCCHVAKYEAASNSAKRRPLHLLAPSHVTCWQAFAVACAGHWCDAINGNWIRDEKANVHYFLDSALLFIHRLNYEVCTEVQHFWELFFFTSRSRFQSNKKKKKSRRAREYMVFVLGAAAVFTLVSVNNGLWVSLSVTSLTSFKLLSRKGHCDVTPQTKSAL